MRFINKYLRNLAPYKVASHKIWEVTKEERHDILKLDWNEATLPPTPNVQKRLRALVEQDDVYYLYPSTHNNLILELLEKYTGCEKACIQYFASSDAAHEYLVRTYVTPGDPILILGPTYDNFRLSSESQGANIYYHDYEVGFIWDLEAFKKSIEKINPSLVYICNPNNPTGNLISKSDIENLLGEFPSIIFLIDEAYYEFSGLTVSDLIGKYNNLFVSRTFSKAFALANFRAGYILTDHHNIEQISKIKNPKNFTTFTQEAVIAVLEDVEYMQAYVENVNDARNQFRDALMKFSFVQTVFESFGNFVLVKFVNADVKERLFQLLAENQIFTRNLTHHTELNSCLRITTGTSEQMNRVISVIEKFEA